MAMIFVRSVSGSNVTLSDNTVVGAVPVLVNTDSAACQSGISQGQIVEVSKEIGELLLGLSRVTSQTQLTGSNDKRVLSIISLATTTAIAAGAIYTGNQVDISQYVAVSSVVQFDVAPGTILQQRIQEIASAGSDAIGSAFNDAAPTSSGVINSNTVYQKRAPLSLGEYARQIIINNDTVSHNILGYTVYGWRN